MDVHDVRSATVEDLPRIRQIDTLCFPDDDPDSEPAAPQELERGIADDRIRVICTPNSIVGFLQFDIPNRDHIYISGLGVHPDFRRRGHATRLLDSFLYELRDVDLTSASITTSTSPRNVAMLRLLLSRKFVARTLFPDYFGPGKDRLHCQYKTRAGFTDPDDRYLVPSTSMASVVRLLNQESYVLTDVVDGASGQVFYEVTRFDPSDPSSMEASETGDSLTFAAAILGALTFLLGFSFASSSYPDGARLILLASTFASCIALVVYANASGDLFRLNVNTFSLSMKWGNVLSEWGGVMPLSVTLPITFANVSHSIVASYAAGAIIGLGTFAYEMSPFSYRKRFGNTWYYMIFVLLTSALAILGVASLRAHALQWAWSSTVLAVMAGRILVTAPTGVREISRSDPDNRWRSRE